MTNYISSSAVARRLGIKTQTLAKWRCPKRGPKGWIHLSATRTVYPEHAVEDFIRELAERRPEFNLTKTGATPRIPPMGTAR